LRKECRLCALRGQCKDLPGYCLLLNYIAIIALLGTLGYLFFSGLLS
jgi:hypothetical protein